MKWLAGLLLASQLPGQAAGLSVGVADPAGKPLAEVVVYAEPLDAKPPKGRLQSSIDQIDKEFVPLVNVVQTGTAIRFPNKDNIRHNIYSFSPAKVFDLKLYSGTPSSPVVFEQPGNVVLGCKIHDWMIGHLLIVDTPWFAKSDARGELQLDGLPAGNYLLHAWHPYQLAMATPQKARVGAGAQSRFGFQLKLAPPPPSVHAN